MGVLDDEVRVKTLHFLCAKLRLEGDFNFDVLEKAAPGYVGADLSALTSAAGVIVVKRTFKPISEGVLVLPLDILPPPDGIQGSGETEQPARELWTVPLLLYLSQSIKHKPNNRNQSSTVSSPVSRSCISWYVRITFSDFHNTLNKVRPHPNAKGSRLFQTLVPCIVSSLHRIIPASYQGGTTKKNANRSASEAA
ncbi:hypothetical protein M378DRAFT_14942 [Amanita muscaria Koide BX008]|uniref:Uncharacterized protein n=1 Tax=Amanita muscaria (strain Koide BX008) TaxID=946122 RepID=A0A0C2WSB8_AMAMK|nr:hypothetical protein M378DRAFT_14942 [Amanita muscaria Koide BX008]